MKTQTMLSYYLLVPPCQKLLAEELKNEGTGFKQSDIFSFFYFYESARKWRAVHLICT